MKYRMPFKYIFKNILIKWGSCIILPTVAKTSLSSLFKVLVSSSLLWLSSLKLKCDCLTCPSQRLCGIAGLSAMLQVPETALRYCTALPFSWRSGMRGEKEGNRSPSLLLSSLFSPITLHSHVWISFLKDKGHFKRESQKIHHGQETWHSRMTVLPSYGAKCTDRLWLMFRSGALCGYSQLRVHR